MPATVSELKARATARVHELGADLAALADDIHAHPEVGFLEIRTAGTVLRHLRGLPFTVRTGAEAMRPDVVAGYPDEPTRERAAEQAAATGADPGDVETLRREGTAVIAEIEGARPGPTWGLRFDMDALPLTEAVETRHRPAAEGFRSRHEGVMHACGHDGHVAIGIVLAHRLADRDFPGRVRFLFQPAEEGVRGARAMVAAGAADGLERFVAVHLGLDVPAGVVVGGTEGAFATTKLRAVFAGVASHAAAAPQEGRNALVGAATALLNILALPRWSTADTRLNVGTLHGGDNVNIIPARAELTCEARSTDGAVSDDLTERVKRVLRAAAEMHGLEVQIEETGGSTTIRSDPELADQLGQVARARYGEAAVGGATPMRGSDDASLFMREVQRAGGLATYAIVGGGNPAPHHNPYFDIDESALPVAVDVLEDLIRSAGPARDSRPSPPP
jgi:aminobenzoyl-glutamate utilization protein A